MATIKSYTDIPQSKKLAEILPITSIDFAWNIFSDGSTRLLRMDDWEVSENAKSNVEIIPCWSLAALLSVIPIEIFDGEYIITITEGCDVKWVLTYDHYENRNHSYFGLSSGADNLVDACVVMILKLHERKML